MDELSKEEQNYEQGKADLNPENSKRLVDGTFAKEKTGCPCCGAPIDKIDECHPFSSDAGAYFICTICNTRLEPDEMGGP